MRKRFMNFMNNKWTPRFFFACFFGFIFYMMATHTPDVEAKQPPNHNFNVYVYHVNSAGITTQFAKTLLYKADSFRVYHTKGYDRIAHGYEITLLSGNKAYISGNVIIEGVR